MSAQQLVERTRQLLLDEIQAKINQALLDIRTDRTDNKVTTEPPRKYFIYDGAQTYECPVVFCVVDSMDIPEDRFGPNHVNALVRINV